MWNGRSQRRDGAAAGIGWNADSPRPNPIRLILKRRVEFRAQQVPAFAHNQPAVVRPVRQQIHQSLQTSEAWPRAVLVLVRPGRVLFQVFAVRERHVDGVEGDDQVGVFVHFGERVDHARFAADGPCEGLVWEAVAGAHPFFVDDGEVGGGYCGGVVAVVTQTAARRLIVSFFGLTLLDDRCNKTSCWRFVMGLTSLRGTCEILRRIGLLFHVGLRL